MADEKHIIDCDYTEIEQRVLAFFNGGSNSLIRNIYARQKQECLDALMTPTGRRRPSHPEMQNV